MFIFYDFETSSRELLGQILSYSFIVTDATYNTIDECSGYIKLNRLQLPEPEAILVNKIDISWLQKNGDSEYDAALKIHSFLNKLLSTGVSWTLVGFNSNQFDLNFLRVLFIRYGLNPYFKGKLKNTDMLHVSQHVAFENESSFPWTLKDSDTPYYVFTLEALTKGFDLLKGTQTHDAKEDVLLTIALAKHYKNHYNLSLETFIPFNLEETSTVDNQTLFKVKTRHFPKDKESLNKYTYKTYMLLAPVGKAFLCIDLETVNSSEPLKSMRYFNSNKNFLITEALTTIEQEMAETVISKIKDIDLFKILKQTPNHYFDLIKKEWDIDYQIHELGFKNIDRLGPIVLTLIKTPFVYEATLKQLLRYRNDEKDTFLIQLYNRVYLNYHPPPQMKYIQKYITPRYITGELLKNWDNFRPIEDSIEFITTILKNENIDERDKTNMQALKTYYKEFSLNYIPGKESLH
jgi:hypothetical protein